MSREHPEVLFVSSAGNKNAALNGKNGLKGFDLPNLLTVCAVDGEGNKAGFSNYATAGGMADLAAPGVDLLVGYDPCGTPPNNYVTASGTSFSSPQVAATAVLMKSICPSLTAEEIREMIRASAEEAVTVGGKTTLIAPELGGRILRVDKAVYRAVKKQLEIEGEPVADIDTLLAPGRIRHGTGDARRRHTLRGKRRGARRRRPLHRHLKRHPAIGCIYSR